VNNAWDRRKSETARAFEAARTYLELGPERSLCAVAQILSKSLCLLKGWSSKHNWVDRAEAWDDYLADKAAKHYAEARVKEAERMAKRHVQHQEAVQIVVVHPVEILLRRINSEPTRVAAEMDGLSTVALLELTTKLAPALCRSQVAERLARGVDLASPGTQEDTVIDIRTRVVQPERKG
jgi:hypothetical protein